jgi:4-hydroxy-tetrahydrodipicolinate reductase
MGVWVCDLLESKAYSGRATLSAKVMRGEKLDALFDCDVVIDFSSPEAALEFTKLAMGRGTALPAFVVGSTGWSDEQKVALKVLSAFTPLFQSSNFSTGVLVMEEILRSYSGLLTKLGYRPEMTETHHQHKKDSPSGTALLLKSAMGSGDLQIESIRRGEVIGDHEVTFTGPSDRIVLGHFAKDRSIFGRGAIDVALWLIETKQKPGLIDVKSYLEHLKGN